MTATLPHAALKSVAEEPGITVQPVGSRLLFSDCG